MPLRRVAFPPAAVVLVAGVFAVWRCLPPSSVS